MGEDFFDDAERRHQAREHSWFTTASGRRFFVIDPDRESIVIDDIAHALAHVCRYGGHCRQFYSVAQHSVHVSKLVPRHLALHGLMHDASEAYLGDVVRPLKAQLPEYKRIEHQLEQLISERFGIRPLGADEVKILKAADLVALQTERRDLLPPTPHEWSEDRAGIVADPDPIFVLASWRARDTFLARYRDLTTTPGAQ